MTQNFTTIYRDWYRLANYLDHRLIVHFPGLAKNKSALTLTATNQTARPLAVKQFSLVPGLPTHKQEFCSPSPQPSSRCKTHAFLPPQFAIKTAQSYHDNSYQSIMTLLASTFRKIEYSNTIQVSMLRKELAKIKFINIIKISKAHLQLENRKLQMSLKILILLPNTRFFVLLIY